MDVGLRQQHGSAEPTYARGRIAAAGDANERLHHPSVPQTGCLAVLAFGGRLPDMTMPRVIALAAVMIFVGFGVGYAVTAPRHPGAHSVDVGFLQDMRFHHDQAVGMALILLEKPTDGANLNLRVIAQEILLDQQLESGTMVAILGSWGQDSARDEDVPAMQWMGLPVPQDQMTGIATPAQIVQLKVATGAAADKMFAELMTAHHEGGIHMALYAEEHASTAGARRLAHSMVVNEQSDIEELARLAPAG
jgi:uncharacterized protein (DUF305 family)